jgi:type I restriction enzyme R subunit
MTYTEYGTVEKPIIDWLRELGWEYVSADDLKRDVEEPFCLPALRQAIKTLNPHVIQSDEDVEKVINQIRRCSNDIAGNRDFFEWLKGERSIVFKQGEKAQTIRLIDYDNPENNSFAVTNQFKFAGYENVRFDIVLMVNGIPLVIIEAKNSTKEQIDYTEAINQLLRYHRDAPQIFKYLAFVCATDGFTFKYDWTDPKRYFNWRNKEADPLEASVKGLFPKAQFLDFIQNFIVFEKAHEKISKKIAMQQQFNAVNRIVHRVLHEDVDRGLIWHTQGSGKTLTMLFAAWKLKKIPQLNNPTIIVIVDRLELQKNMLDTFGNVNFSYTTKAENTRSLLGKLKQDSREVIITTIQKFEPVRDILSQRKNIIVLIDEAHRTQYGRLASYMRNAFPHAKIFGFTGTPIDKGPMGRSTFRTFCSPKERYLDKYSIRQSIEDGSTVRIIYEPRLPEAHVPKETLDEEFLKITADLSEEDQDRVMQKSAKLRTILKARSRIEKVAEDIANHYRTHVEPNGFKAQLAAVDREACALYKEELDKHLPPEYSTVIYTPAPNDDELLRKYHMPKEEQLNIARNTFQRPEELPKIIIVTDMLLTGFDAPIEEVMYLDKPLRDHKLLQAIARTNRPYPNKEAGIIIDYVGIFDNLKAALNFEEEEIEGVADLIDTLKKEFAKQITDLRAMFKGVERADSRESLFKVTQILEDSDRLKEFKQKLLTAKKLFETVAPDPELVKYLDDYSWFIQIKA